MWVGRESHVVLHSQNSHEPSGSWAPPREKPHSSSFSRPLFRSNPSPEINSPSSKARKINLWVGRDLNPQPFRDTVLSRTRMPIPPPTRSRLTYTKQLTTTILFPPLKDSEQRWKASRRRFELGSHISHSPEKYICLNGFWSLSGTVSVCRWTDRADKRKPRTPPLGGGE